jgi:hypothetical protein
MSTFKTSTRHNKSNWNNYTRSNNKKPLKLKRVEQQEKQQDEVVDKALEEAKRIADIANKATKRLANPNISVQKKRKVIIELTKELKQSVSLLDKIRDWFRNLTRKIRDKLSNFGRGIKKFFTREKKKTIRWRNEADREPLINTRTYNLNNTPNSLNCSKVQEKNYTEGELSIQKKVVDLLNKINYGAYGRKYLKHKCARQDFFNRTVAKFVDYLTDNDPLIIKNILSNFDINSEESVNKVISDWNTFTSDECGKEFIRINFFDSFDKSYFTGYNTLNQNSINLLHDDTLTKFIQFICNIEDNGATQNFILQDGKIFGVKEYYIEREPIKYSKKCRERLINNSDISEERKIQLINSSKNLP